MRKIFITALALLTLASCTKEESTNKGGNSGEAVTLITVTQSPSTRATSPAELDEDGVNNITLYIFNAAKALESIEVFLPGELVTGKEIATTAGNHYFLASVNEPTALMPSVPIAIGDNLDAVSTKILAMNATNLTTITGNDNFFMTNIDGATQKSLVGGGTPGSVPLANTFAIKVGRAMAKVNMSIGAGVLQPNGTLLNVAASDVEYFVAGNPDQMNFGPMYDLTGQLKAPYFNHTFVSPGPAAASQTDADNYFPAIAAADDYSTLTALWKDQGAKSYAVENSNQTPKFGEATYVLMTGTFAPAVWHDATGTIDGTAAVHGVDFYRIGRKNAAGKVEWYGSRYYSSTLSQSEMEAELLAVDLISAPYTDYTMVKYDLGRTYYGIWLADNTVVANPAKKYSVPRNYFFNVTVNEIKGAGSNTPDLIPNPIKPIEESTYISATIDVAPWELIEQGAIIGD